MSNIHISPERAKFTGIKQLITIFYHHHYLINPYILITHVAYYSVVLHVTKARHNKSLLLLYTLPHSTLTHYITLTLHCYSPSRHQRSCWYCMLVFAFKAQKIMLILHAIIALRHKRSCWYCMLQNKWCKKIPPKGASRGSYAKISNLCKITLPEFQQINAHRVLQYEYHPDYPWLVYDILLVSLSWDSMDGTSVVIETWSII